MDWGPNRHRRLRGAVFAPLLAAFLLLASAAAAQANIIVVNTTSDVAPSETECSGVAADCSLRQAADKAQSGDTVQLGAGVYTLTLGADIEIAKSVTLEGAGASTTSVDGSQNRGSNQFGATARILRTDAGATVTIEGLTITGGDDETDEVPCDACATVSLNGGGALWNDGAVVSLDHVAFTGNPGGAIGGVVSNSGGTLTMTSVSFTNDQAAIGGALFTHSGTVSGTGVTFEGSATGCCNIGAIYLLGGTVTLTNSTVVGNGGASSIGGGIHNGGGTLTLTNDTLSGNVRRQLMTDQGASTTVENTIIADGFSEGDGDCIASGRPDEANGGTSGPAITNDLRHNIDQDSSCSLDGTGDSSNVDPKLAPIADNTGPTRTQALLAGSPALGDPSNSDCPAIDQRGVNRLDGSCDIGAFEAVLHGPPTASTGDAASVTDSSADLSATINLDGEAGGFHFVYGTSASALISSSPEAAAGVVSSTTPEAETLSNLSPDTTYYYEAVADNATASTTAPNVEQFTTAPGPPLVSNVTVSSVTDTTATIDFSIDPQGSDTGYVIEYGPDANYGQQTETVDIGSTPGAQSLTATLTRLNPKSPYHFDLVATNAAEESTDSGDLAFNTDQQVTGVAGSQVSVTDSGTTDSGCPPPDPVTVDWGDGSNDSNAQIQCQIGQEDEEDYALTATHTYASPGDYLIAITYYDFGTTTDEYAHISSGVGSPPPSSPPASNPSAPAIATTAPNVSVTSAGFSGSVTPNGLPTQAYFQYALDPKYTGGGALAYSQSTPTQSVGSDFATHTVGPAAVFGLLPNALYHVRLVATNSAGTTFGPDQTFTTEAAPAPGAPTVGRTVNVSPISGFVLIKINGKFVPLTGLDQIPSGSQIDARHGSLELITSTGEKGKTQHGIFGGAIFKLTQERSGKSKGLVTLTLLEGLFKGAPSYAICKRHKAGDASAAAASSKTLQLLHASAHGKFRTKGRYSAATVLGTIWTIADRCNGTLVHDVTDSVVVNDFVHHKTIVLHAGQSYLARRP